MAAPGESAAVLACSTVIRRAYVASPVPRFVCLEMGERLRSTSRQRSSISVMRIIPVVYMAVEAARTAEPWAGASEYASDKPIRPVVSIGRAVIGGVIEVPIRAIWLRSNVHAGADLSRRMSAHCANEACDAQQTKRSE